MVESPSPKVALLPIHGMGPVKGDYAQRFEKALRRRLGGQWHKILFRPVHYQKLLQDNQDRVWEDMRKRNLDWTRLRRFVLFGFSDATGIERHAHCDGSPYTKVQEIIQENLNAVYNETQDPEIPVVVIAQSLGGHVISNYIWDAQSDSRPNGTECTRGVWTKDEASDPTAAAAEEEDEGDRETDPVEAFLRLKSLRFLYTTGCNIPIFVASFPESEIVPITQNKWGYDFKWKNFFDDDDVLGWPLKPLSDAYKDAVCFDKRINAGNLLVSWTPFSHGRYWTDNELLTELVADLESLLDESSESNDGSPSADR